MDGYIGTIMMCAFNFAPKDWMLCQGALVPISQNQAMYSLLGKTYGGDGHTTFGLPHLGSGRVPGGQGTYPGLPQRVMGQGFGYPAIKLQTSQMPSHTHDLVENKPGETLRINNDASLRANKSSADSDTPEDNYCAPTKSGMNTYDSFAASPDTTMNSGAIDIQTTGTLDVNNLTVGHTGEDQFIAVEQPTLVLNFIICAQGLYPQRQ